MWANAASEWSRSGVVAGGHEQLCGHVVADAVHGEQSWRGAVDQRTDHGGELVQLVIE
jgi:hypothetical protein